MMTLGAMLQPISLPQFTADYWGKVPLHISGNPTKFSSFYSLDEFHQTLKTAGARIGLPMPFTTVSFDHGRTHSRIDIADAPKLMQAGGTVCVRDVSQLDDRLAHLAGAIKRRLQFVGRTDFRAYYSPDGQGYDLHFDARISTTLQISGKKRWRFSTEPAIAWPAYQFAAGGPFPESHSLPEWEQFKSPSECSFQEVILEPGDVLCLPAGVWHSAEALGHSFALNMAFGFERGFWPEFAQVVSRIVTASPIWREPPPPVVSGASQDSEAPEGFREYLRERIDDLVETLEELRESPWAINECWRQIWHSSITSLPAKSDNRTLAASAAQA